MEKISSRTGAIPITTEEEKDLGSDIGITDGGGGGGGGGRLGNHAPVCYALKICLDGRSKSWWESKNQAFHVKHCLDTSYPSLSRSSSRPMTKVVMFSKTYFSLIGLTKTILP